VALKCLDECLSQLPEEKRELILEYYQDDKRDRINRRRALAERFGLRRDALANQAQRLREKLEKCIAECRRHLVI
jgi:DNA-directed RNA polymerase specialized sigma24 family protein